MWTREVRKLYRDYFRVLDHHVDILNNFPSSKESSDLQKVVINQRIKENQKLSKGPSTPKKLSGRKLVRKCFSSFFLYSSLRRPELPETLTRYEQYEIILREWEAISEKDRQHLYKRLDILEGFQTFEYEYYYWLKVMHAVNQKRRHDAILRYIHNSLDRERFRVFVDIEGRQTEGGGTIPQDVMETNLTPDIVVIDDHRKSLRAFELTVPLERSVWSCNQRKLSCYQSLNSETNNPLETDYEIFVKPFEVTSITGLLSRDNKNAIRMMHKYCNPDISLATFRSEISVIAALEYRKILNHWLLQ